MMVAKENRNKRIQGYIGWNIRVLQRCGTLFACLKKGEPWENGINVEKGRNEEVLVIK